MSIAFLIVSCVLLDKSDDTLEEAKIGLELAVDQLPKLDGFKTIKINQEAFSHTEYGLTCDYARANIAIGSSLPASDALDQYVEALQSDGWTLKKNQYQQTKSLAQGSNSLIVVYFGEPTIELKDDIDLERLKRSYQSIMFIRLDYMLPNSNEC
jgi:hypothetical protein